MAQHFDGPMRMEETEVWLYLTEEIKRRNSNRAPIDVHESDLCTDCLDALTVRKTDEGVMP